MNFFLERPEGCPSNYFRCERKACVLNSEVCDLTDDCGDNSDERDCSGYNMCDFENNGYCQWSTENTTNAQWTLSSPSSIFYPNRDHTTGLQYGKFLILKGKPGSTFLVSPIFKATNRCEFRIFVFVWNTRPFVGGELNFYSRTARNGGDRLLLKIQNTIGQYWQKRVLEINETVPFQIVIEGVRIDDFLQTIALDDTSFDKGCVVDTSVTLPATTAGPITTQRPCSEGFTCPTNGLCISKEKICDFIKDCPDGSDEKECSTCDFETSSCGWYDGGWNVPWVLKKGPSSNPFGPQNDNSLNKDGSYLLTERLYGESELGAALIGSVLGATSEFCTLSLWIHMGKTNFADLTVYIDIFFSNSSNFYDDYRHLGSIYGPLGSVWRQFKFPIGRNAAGFLIDMYAFLEYSTEYYEFTDVGLDDIKLENCLVTSIPQDQNLDCTFENGFCDYYLDTTGDFLWQRTNAITNTANTGPGFDRNF